MLKEYSTVTLTVENKREREREIYQINQSLPITASSSRTYTYICTIDQFQRSFGEIDSNFKLENSQYAPTLLRIQSDIRPGERQLLSFICVCVCVCITVHAFAFSYLGIFWNV